MVGFHTMYIIAGRGAVAQIILRYAARIANSTIHILYEQEAVEN